MVIAALSFGRFAFEAHDRHASSSAVSSQPVRAAYDQVGLGAAISSMLVSLCPMTDTAPVMVEVRVDTRHDGLAGFVAHGQVAAATSLSAAPTA